MPGKRPTAVTVSMIMLWITASLSLFHALASGVGELPFGAILYIIADLGSGIPWWGVIWVLGVFGGGMTVPFLAFGGFNAWLAIATSQRRRWAWGGNLAWHGLWVLLSVVGLLPIGLAFLGRTSLSLTSISVIFVGAYILWGVTRPDGRAWFAPPPPDPAPALPASGPTGRYCPACGTPAAASSHVCSGCGRLLPGRSAPPAPTRNR